MVTILGIPVILSIWRLVTLASGVTNPGIDLRNRDQFTQLPPPSSYLITISSLIGMPS